MTIKDFLNAAADDSPDNVALKFKRGGAWNTIGFGALRERAWHVAEMLLRLGIQKGDRVAIFRENTPEWFEIYYGIIGIGAVAVPVDAKLREQEVAHIFHDCGVSAVFCSARLAVFDPEMVQSLHRLRAIVALDCGGESPPASDGAAVYDYTALWQDVSADALAPERAFDRMGPEADSPASFIYTSGTTGRQKGAVLTHRNFLSNVEGMLSAVGFVRNDNLMLVLPLHHSFAFTCIMLVSVRTRCQISLVQSLKTLKPDMEECKPTVLLAVPLLLEKMLMRMLDGIRDNASATLMYRFGLAKLIGDKIKEGLGGALRLIVSGGAPISPATLEAWSKLGFTIVEGYGITETAPVLSVNPPAGPRVGTVGLPIAGVEIKIADPNAEGIGEIVARGDNVMQGYHNNPEETAKVLVDGWYHTGDLGHFDEKGYLVISGRKKSMIVNREGKNIYPEEVELQAMNSEYVLECLSLGYCEPGDSAGERVGLIVVPNIAVFDAVEDREGQRLSDAQIEERVREDVRLQLSALSDYKRPRKIEVRFEEFEKTSTQKVKRYLYAIDTGGKSS
ncbi:AMP-dependent synthetase/ligase [Pontiella sulfatireligans]|uniref:Long-chain-fatty-acid--CoA ligase n=1 Tax=Pontiella sulfatireligans TaxID=2750658 RepID=A0A6C2UK77_9BACT|nr:AMP-binding protein [Pontiella sulfatireligans]VGO20635.1 Long-chain-fatty-acid--CoA ligase [Pontiella sulfatireligans]